jgi:hypothetical protein
VDIDRANAAFVGGQISTLIMRRMIVISIENSLSAGGSEHGELTLLNNTIHRLLAHFTFNFHIYSPLKRDSILRLSRRWFSLAKEKDPPSCQVQSYHKTQVIICARLALQHMSPRPNLKCTVQQINFKIGGPPISEPACPQTARAKTPGKQSVSVS